MKLLFFFLALHLPASQAGDNITDDNIETVQLAIHSSRHLGHSHVNHTNVDAQSALVQAAPAEFERQEYGWRRRRRRGPSIIAAAIVSFVSCKCSNGAAKATFACIFQKSNNCKSCNPGYYKSGNSCNLKRCKCQGGPAHSGSSCPTNGDNYCSTCDDGYTKSVSRSRSSCSANVCKCTGGTAVSGSLCTSDGLHKCKHCGNGFYLKNGRCLTCSSCGTGQLMERKCSANSNTVCICGPGYAESSPGNCKACTGKTFQDEKGKNKCDVCPDGSGGLGTLGAGNTGCKSDTCERPLPPANATLLNLFGRCPRNAKQGAICKMICISGFKTIQSSPHTCKAIQGTATAVYQGGDIACKEHQCTCENGVGEKGLACGQDGAAECASCDDGYYLAGPRFKKQCKANVCTCDDGDGAKGKECPANGGYTCSVCNIGWTLDDGVCNANKCTCSNGEGATAKKCISNGAPTCVDCDDGYWLLSGKCHLNTCTCKNGVPAQGKECPINGENTCDTCNVGYYLQAGSCHEKVCSCEDGIAARGRKCAENNKPKCSSCDPSFYLDGDKCTTCTVCGRKEEVARPCGPAADTVCQCSPGYVGQPGRCKACSLKFDYQDEAGQASCKKCDDGSRAVGPQAHGHIRCLDGKCQRPVPPINALVDETNCPKGGVQETSTCKFVCRAGYRNDRTVSESGPATCLAVTGSTDAAYQNGRINCVPYQCSCQNGTAATGVGCGLYKRVATGEKCKKSPKRNNGLCDAIPGDKGDGKFSTLEKCHECVAKSERCHDSIFSWQPIGHSCKCLKAEKNCLKGGSRFTGRVQDETYTIYEANSAPGGPVAQCVDCADGYRLVGTTCKPNECSCANGNGATGENCPDHGDDLCEGCNAGFELEGGQCQENVCTCPNGIGMVGINCPRSGQQLCSDCNEGFYLSDGLCRENLCTCPNGIGASGLDCPETNTKSCESCQANFWLRGSDCIECSDCGDDEEVLAACSATNDIVCQCTQCFVGSQGSCGACNDREFQDEPGQSDCKICANGAVGTNSIEAGGVGNNGCKNSRCQRPSPPTGSNSKIDANGCPSEAEQGTKCNLLCVAGYSMVTSSAFTCEAVEGSGRAEYRGGSIECKINECTCENGEGTRGVDCPEHGAAICTSCTDGYRLVNKACEIKQCTCESGQGATGTECVMHDGEACSRCDAGFNLVSGECRVPPTPRPTPRPTHPPCTCDALGAQRESCKLAGNDDGCGLDGSLTVGMGDCDSDADCSGSLKCGTNNCPWGDGDDCCYSCDCSPEAAQASNWCATTGNDDGCGSSRRNPMPNGYGDCDWDSECVNDCGTNNCPWGDGDDCCQDESSGWR